MFMILHEDNYSDFSPQRLTWPILKRELELPRFTRVSKAETNSFPKTLLCVLFAEGPGDGECSTEQSIYMDRGGRSSNSSLFTACKRHVDHFSCFSRVGTHVISLGREHLETFLSKSFKEFFSNTVTIAIFTKACLSRRHVLFVLLLYYCFVGPCRVWYVLRIPTPGASCSCL